MKYLIMTGEFVGNDNLFWKKNSRGYTDTFDDAGRYTKEEAESIIKVLPGKKLMAVTEETAKKFSHTVCRIPYNEIELKGE